MAIANGCAPEGPLEKDTLTIVLISDVHSSMVNVTRCVEKTAFLQLWPDFVFLTGDIANMDNKQPNDIAVVSKFEGDVAAILEEAGRVAGKVVYLPGNHDPPTLFDRDEAPSLCSSAYNIHCRRLRIAKNLVLVGFGGAPPAFRQNGIGREKVWDGYPFDNELEMKRSMRDFFSESANPARVPLLGQRKEDKGTIPRPALFCSMEDDLTLPLKPKDQIIFLSHCGPASSKTTIVEAEDGSGKIYSGSTSVEDLLCHRDNPSRAVVCIHGHTHASRGQAKVADVPVVNPGSLK
mmetsp:Transcript_47742/g.123817  ORF Transcript_47742/g.123817 Transcript_47742/m.123817 type:complete len:292 (+) Transcript_47742:60-935(+)